MRWSERWKFKGRLVPLDQLVAENEMEKSFFIREEENSPLNKVNVLPCASSLRVKTPNSSSSKSSKDGMHLFISSYFFNRKNPLKLSTKIFLRRSMILWLGQQILFFNHLGLISVPSRSDAIGDKANPRGQWKHADKRQNNYQTHQL